MHIHNFKVEYMTNIKSYLYTRFSSNVLQLAHDQFLNIINNLDKKHKIFYSFNLNHDALSTWYYDDINEFFTEYRKYNHYAKFIARYGEYELGMTFYAASQQTDIEIRAINRAEIALVSEIFEKHLSESIIKHEEPDIKPVIFMGHGRSHQWRDLKDHLQDKHGYKIEAYETGARAGHSIRDILEDMVSKSSFALLILTAEDEQADGSYRCRQNVVHETGLFQEKLGFHRAIVLMEDQVEEFSNIQGIQQIRYSKNNIKETFGEVLATLKREFEK